MPLCKDYVGGGTYHGLCTCLGHCHNLGFYLFRLMDIGDGSHVIIIVVYEACSGGPEAALRSQIPGSGEAMHIVTTCIFKNRVFSENGHTV